MYVLNKVDLYVMEHIHSCSFFFQEHSIFFFTVMLTYFILNNDLLINYVLTIINQKHFKMNLVIIFLVYVEKLFYVLTLISYVNYQSYKNTKVFYKQLKIFNQKQ